MLIKKGKKLNNYLFVILLVLAFICLIINMIMVANVKAPNIFNSDRGSTLNLNFDIYEDGNMITTSALPYAFDDSIKNKEIELISTLPSDKSINNSYLLIRTSGSSLIVEIDGEEIYNFHQENVNDYGGGYYNFIKLPNNSDNKQIKLKIFCPTDNPFSQNINKILIGTQGFLITEAFESEYESIFFGIVLISFGLVFLGSILFFNKSFVNPYLQSLSLLLICLGFWVFTQSKAKQLLGITNPSLPMIISFFTMVSLPICLWFYTSVNYKKIKDYKILKHSAITILSLYIPITIISFLNVSYTKFLSFIGILLLLYTLLLGIISIKIYKKGEKPLFSCIFALSSILISIIAEEILLILGISIKHVSFLHLGMAFAAVIFIYRSIGNIVEKNSQNNEAKLLKKLAYIDVITLVENRNAYEKFLREKSNYFDYLGIILADVNGLKIINDKYGHKYGDALLKKVSKELKESLPQDSHIYRVGGDEFVGIIRTLSEKEFNKFINELQKKFVPSKSDFGMAIGSYYYKKDSGENLKEAIEKTDINMYKQKEALKDLIYKNNFDKAISKELLFSEINT